MVLHRARHTRGNVHRIRAKKSIFKRPWFWLSLLIIAVILTAFYFLLFYPGFQIKNVLVSGNKKVNTQELQAIILNNSNTGLVRFWLLNITSKSIFLLNTDKLDKEILEKFPAIESLKINKEFPQTITIEIAERKPIGIFCPSADENNCFLIDQNGIIFEPLTGYSSASPTDFTIVRQTFGNNQVFTGEEVVAQNIINDIAKIQKNLKDNFQIDLKEALVTSPLRLNVKTSENWQVYFNLDASSDINSQITKLNLLLSGGISASDRKNLRYINLIPKDKAEICDNAVCGG